MRHYRWTGASLSMACGVLGTVAGCQKPPPPPQAPPLAPPVTIMSPTSYSQMKAAYLRTNPDARVGRVLEVLPAEHRLTVGDIPTKDFQKGDVLSIVDADMNVIADGTVLDVDPQLLYVAYVAPTIGTNRPPMKGDVAIRALTPDRSKYR